MVRGAWAIGETINLSDAWYGPKHWKEPDSFSSTPFPYYYFLAGLVRSQGCSRIFEIGTHYGGSARSMLHGATEPNVQLVTIDVTDLNPALHALPCVVKLTGDANGAEAIQEAMDKFGPEPIDLLYIDADHKFAPTITNLGLYSLLLKPRLVVIDDIVLNEGMRDFWNVVRAAYGSDAINCVDVVPEIRSEKCGFGLLRLRRHLPTMDQNRESKSEMRDIRKAIDVNLDSLKREHNNLDIAITELSSWSQLDDSHLQELKKRKLTIGEAIAKLEGIQLPD